MTMALVSLHKGRMQIMMDSGSPRRGRVQHDRDFGVTPLGTNANHGRFRIISQGKRFNMTETLASPHQERVQIIVDSGSSRKGKVQYDRDIGVTPRGTSATHGRFRVISQGKGPL